MGTLVAVRDAYDPFAVVMGGKRGLAPAELRRLEADAIREGRTVSVWFYGESDDRLMVVGDISGASQYEESDGPFELIRSGGDLDMTVVVERVDESWQFGCINVGHVLSTTLFRWEDLWPREVAYTPLRAFYERAGLPESTATYLDENEMFTQVLRVDLPVEGRYTIYPRGMVS